MRMVIQRVQSASVHIQDMEHTSIGQGLLILLGIERDDSDEDADWLAGKVSLIRLFDDNQGVMNRSVIQVGGELLVISQFTLHASTKKGNRPSYIKAAPAEKAAQLYHKFISLLKENSGIDVKSGVFGADMQVQLINDGPVTILIDSKQKE
ncbi:MAG: D-tyrosyl-tRNA(Tyr) deacylase [Bacteroidia bacterium]|nr:D-tyrosyl-tRNA(Tyr) deacylase [Bacteroidia bacterium]MCZ2277318.1 D-tyrosyl-tRNA(Tyr) deacylase [Bacteroidia bacterium]